MQNITAIAAAAVIALAATTAVAAPPFQGGGDSSAQATGIGVGVGKGGSATAVGQGGHAHTTNTNTNTNTNVNTNQQGQEQGQVQSQTQGQGQSTDVGVDVAPVGSGNTTTVTNEAPDVPVSSAIAPNVNSTAPCVVGVSAGAQTAPFGFSFGGAVTSEVCEQLEIARIGASLADPAAQNAATAVYMNVVRQYVNVDSQGQPRVEHSQSEARSRSGDHSICSGETMAPSSLVARICD
jgi:hypothetical protein